jgi:pyruvate dehydrogenase E1 component alpha subunit
MNLEGVRAIRSGEGPRFYEFATYRWREHCGPLYDNDIGYRSEAEFLAWQANDPIIRLQAFRPERLTAEEIAGIEAKVDAEVAAAFAFAEDSPFPEPGDAFSDIYAAAPKSPP